MERDLSSYNNLVSGIFTWPRSKGDWERYRLSEEQAALLEKPVPVDMERGYASFHHPLLVHGSFENLSERPRRAFVLNVFADGTISDSDQEILTGVPRIPKGRKMEGQFFSFS